MAKEKPLSEKTDYYSIKRKATIDIITWLSEGLTDQDILLKLLMKYGFGNNFFYTVKELYKNKTKQNKKTK